MALTRERLGRWGTREVKMELERVERRAEGREELMHRPP